MFDSGERLRVAFVAGTLGQGGAEKQLVYMAQALLDADVDVRVYSLTRGEFHEPALRALGLQPVWIGRIANPLFRLAALASALRPFQPHVIQSTHAFTNLYAGVVGRLLNAISLGAMRSSLQHSAQANGRWTKWLVTGSSALLVNSQTAFDEMIKSKLISQRRLYLVPNAINPVHSAELDSAKVKFHPTAIFVGRLIPVKRLDRFIRALAQARQQHPLLKGIIVGDGPEREAMGRIASEVGLGTSELTFLGRRDDVPDLLRQSSMLVFCSDDEGFPNVLLEAMAACVPVVTTPAGDAGQVVEDGLTGYVVPFDDIEAMAERMVRLANSPDLCRRLGEAGRKRIEQHYSFESLATSLLSVYRDVAQQQNHCGLLRVLSV